MKREWPRAALAATALGGLLALAACGDRVENTEMPQPGHASVEINRQGEPGAADPQAADAGAPQTRVLGAGSASLAAMSPEYQRIAGEVRQALASDPRLGAAQIDVHSQDGMVTLRGRAPDSEARDKAREIARGVGGVKSVDNALTLG